MSRRQPVDELTLVKEGKESSALSGDPNLNEQIQAQQRRKAVLTGLSVNPIYSKSIQAVYIYTYSLIQCCQLSALFPLNLAFFKLDSRNLYEQQHKKTSAYFCAGPGNYFPFT